MGKHAIGEGRLSASLDPSILPEIIEYNKETGELFWKPRSAKFFKDHKFGTAEKQALAFNKRFAGKPALSMIDNQGYLIGRLFGKFAASHRVIWALCHGYWPIEVDHENGIKTDNRLSNLRDVSHHENTKNQAIKINNKSGCPGVYWKVPNKKYEVTIRANGKSLYLGLYRDYEEAVKVRKAAERQYGYHENTGRPIDTRLEPC